MNRFLINRKETIESIKNKNLEYMKCRTCNSKFKINWTKYGGFPIPIYDEFTINVFLYKYNKPGN